MKHLLVILLSVTNLLSCAQEASAELPLPETSTFYFIRHAEKDRTDSTNSDPELVQEGLLRAVKWSYVLNDIEFDAVYSTDYKRTKQTALPTAEKNNLEITIYDPTNLDGNAFVEENKGKSVLVVGHSNTTPAFVNAVLGENRFPDMADDDNGSLFVVTISPSGEKSVSRLIIE